MTASSPEAARGSRTPSPIELTSAQFHILLTLSEGARHGYGIMQAIAERTNGATELGPGTLYRSIKQLLRAGLIAEVDSKSDSPDGSTSRRRTYALTPTGRVRVAEEAERLWELVRWAQEAMVLEGGRP